MRYESHGTGMRTVMVPTGSCPGLSHLVKTVGLWSPGIHTRDSSLVFESQHWPSRSVTVFEMKQAEPQPLFGKVDKREWMLLLLVTRLHWAGKVAQLVKCLPCKHEDLSAVACACDSSAGIAINTTCKTEASSSVCGVQQEKNIVTRTVQLPTLCLGIDGMHISQ